MDIDPVEAAESAWDPDYKHDQLLEAVGGVEGGEEGGDLAIRHPTMEKESIDTAVNALGLGLAFIWGQGHSLTYSYTYSLTHSLTHSLTYLLTHPPTHPLTHLPTHSLSH